MSAYFVDKSQCTPKTIFPGVQIQTAAGEQMMLSLVRFDPGAVVEAHAHPHEQVGMVLEGRAHFFVGEEDRVLGPGDMYTIPGGVTHRVVALDGTVQALDIFHPVRDDYIDT
jgi:quercetin dioxygenase-like cupin family protein